MRLVVLQRWTRLGRKQAIQSAVRLGRIQWGRSLFPDRARGRRESLQHIADSYLDVEIRVRSMLQAQRRHNNDNTATATATAAATAAATAIATTIATTTTTTIIITAILLLLLLIIIITLCCYYDPQYFARPHGVEVLDRAHGGHRGDLYMCMCVCIYIEREREM